MKDAFKTVSWILGVALMVYIPAGLPITHETLCMFLLALAMALRGPE